MTLGSDELRVPSAESWGQYLEFELTRREKRQAFLWTVTISTLGLASVSASFLFWNARSDLIREYVVAAAIGSLVFLAILGPIAARLLTLAQPKQLFVALDLKQTLAVVRLTRMIGMPLSSKAIRLPEIIALFLVALGAFVASPPELPSWVPGAISGLVVIGMMPVASLLLVLNMALLLLPRASVASLISFAVLSMARSRGLSGREWGESGVVQELRSLVRWKYFQRTLDSDASPVKPGLGAGFRAVWFLFVVVFGLIFLWNAFGEPLMRSDLAALVSSVVLGLSLLSFARLLLVLYFDETTVLLEQLRFAAFTKSYPDEVYPMAYIVVEGLQQMRMHTKDALHDLVVMLQLQQLYWTDRQRDQLKAP